MGTRIAGLRASYQIGWSCQEGIALSVARQSDLGGANEEGKLGLE
jgi:hypothetical protein